jgi:hypothetical protein
MNTSVNPIGVPLALNIKYPLSGWRLILAFTLPTNVIENRVFLIQCLRYLIIV